MKVETMTETQFKEIIIGIVKNAALLKDEFTDQQGIPVNYACIFCQSENEFSAFQMLANKIGKIIENTPSGPLFRLDPVLDTTSGKLQLLKVRAPDLTRKERGDADFTVSDYSQFKNKYLTKPFFSLITKPDFEMIELFVPSVEVRVYFSNPPLDVQLGLI